jgi:hypothetical protein
MSKNIILDLTVMLDGSALHDSTGTLVEYQGTVPCIRDELSRTYSSVDFYTGAPGNTVYILWIIVSYISILPGAPLVYFYTGILDIHPLCSYRTVRTVPVYTQVRVPVCTVLYQVPGTLWCTEKCCKSVIVRLSFARLYQHECASVGCRNKPMMMQ